MTIRQQTFKCQDIELETDERMVLARESTCAAALLELLKAVVARWGSVDDAASFLSTCGGAVGGSIV